MSSLIRRSLLIALASLALPQAAFAASDLVPLVAASSSSTAVVTVERPTFLVVHETLAPSLAGLHYRPRMRRRVGPLESAGVSQVHLGWFDPDGPRPAQFDLGVRGGPLVDTHLQLGVAVDWIHRSEQTSSISRTTTGPGGVPIEVRQDLTRASSNMFPIMGFVQFSAADEMPVIPYFGAAGGYQVLALSGDDFITGTSYDATFSGWGWQLWGGLGLPLGGRTRLNGEVYVNGASLGHDATDVLSGVSVHETVNADGMGMRFGVAWGF